MSYPSLSSYVDAVQNPSIVFQDPDLRTASVEKNPMGLPRPISGGFAVTFRMNNGAKSWAVRCFRTEVPDLESRYAALTDSLPSLGMPELIPFQYVRQGILVEGTRYPIVKMQWITGQTLGSYVDQYFADRPKMQNLLQEFRSLIASLEKHGIAHRDLQHGNLIVEGSRFRLIDYDGMYVPALASRRASEEGHVNFQSPQRDETHYGPFIDRFSAIVISISLQALIKKPRLWSTYSEGDNLLFKRSDFVYPAKSALLDELAQIREFEHQIAQFRILCRSPIERIPLLEDFLSGDTTVSEATVASAPLPSRIRMRQYEVVEATDKGGLRRRVGQLIEVVGIVVDVAILTARNNRPYAVVNFGNWRHGDFRLMVWEESLQLLREHGQNLHSLVGKWVSVTGLIQTWANSPRIYIDEPGQINQLGGAARAKELLAEGKHDQDLQQSSTSSVQNDRATLNQDVRRRLQGMAPRQAGSAVPQPRSNPVNQARRSARDSAPSTGSTPQNVPTPNQRVRQKLDTLESPSTVAQNTKTTHAHRSSNTSERTSGSSPAHATTGSTPGPTGDPKSSIGDRVVQFLRTWMWWIIGAVVAWWLFF